LGGDERSSERMGTGGSVIIMSGWEGSSRQMTRGEKGKVNSPMNSGGDSLGKPEAHVDEDRRKK